MKFKKIPDKFSGWLEIQKTYHVLFFHRDLTYASNGAKKGFYNDVTKACDIPSKNSDLNITVAEIMDVNWCSYRKSADYLSKLCCNLLLNVQGLENDKQIFS